MRSKEGVSISILNTGDAGRIRNGPPCHTYVRTFRAKTGRAVWTLAKPYFAGVSAPWCRLPRIVARISECCAVTLATTYSTFLHTLPEGFRRDEKGTCGRSTGCERLSKGVTVRLRLQVSVLWTLTGGFGTEEIRRPLNGLSKTPSALIVSKNGPIRCSQLVSAVVPEHPLLRDVVGTRGYRTCTVVIHHSKQMSALRTGVYTAA